MVVSDIKLVWACRCALLTVDTWLTKQWGQVFPLNSPQGTLRLKWFTKDAVSQKGCIYMYTVYHSKVWMVFFQNQNLYTLFKKALKLHLDFFSSNLIVQFGFYFFSCSHNPSRTTCSIYLKTFWACKWSSATSPKINCTNLDFTSLLNKNVLHLGEDSGRRSTQ